MVKNINDARYRQNEQIIQDGLVKHFRTAKDAVTFSVGQFCKKIGILDRTFRNHGGLDGELRRMSRNVSRNMKTIAKKNMEKQQNAKQLYFSVMLYMKAHQGYFEINQKRHNVLLWEITLRELRSAVEQIWRSSYGKEKDEIIYTLYCGGIAAVFSFWAESGFAEDQFLVVLKRIERLTTGAPARLVRFA